MKWISAAVLSGLLALAPVAYSAPVDINSADAKTLDQAMSGVGPKVAQAIVDYRAKNGPFKSVDDLSKVKGVGKRTIEKNRSNVTVGKPAAR